MLVLTVNNSRSPRIIGNGAEEYRRVWVGTLTTFGGVAIVSMLLKLDIARGYLLIALPIGLMLLLHLRWWARRALIAYRRRYGRCMTRVLAVGSVAAVRDLATSLAREPWSGYVVAGACIPGRDRGSELAIPGLGSIPVIGDETHIVEAVRSTDSHAVAVTATERLHGRAMQDLSWALEALDVDMLVAPGVVDVAGPRLEMQPVAGLPLIWQLGVVTSRTMTFGLAVVPLTVAGGLLGGYVLRMLSQRAFDAMALSLAGVAAVWLISV